MSNQSPEQRPWYERTAAEVHKLAAAQLYGAPMDIFETTDPNSFEASIQSGVPGQWRDPEGTHWAVSRTVRVTPGGTDTNVQLHSASPPSPFCEDPSDPQTLQGWFQTLDTFVLAQYPHPDIRYSAMRRNCEPGGESTRPLTPDELLLHVHEWGDPRMIPHDAPDNAICLERMRNALQGHTGTDGTINL